MATEFDESNADEIMESSVGNGETSTTFRPFTKAERIQQLNEIDKSITQLLRSAGLAIKTLTDCQSDLDNIVQQSDNRSKNFTDATNNYLNVLHSVDVRLKRQIYGLNEAGIIGRGRDSTAESDGQPQDGPRAAVDRDALDIGWLNSRSGRVGKDMEAELWAKSKSFLEGQMTEKSDIAEIDAKKDEDMGL